MTIDQREQERLSAFSCSDDELERLYSAAVRATHRAESDVVTGIGSAIPARYRCPSIVMAPWEAYRSSADLRLLRKSWPAMVECAGELRRTAATSRPGAVGLPGHPAVGADVATAYCRRITDLMTRLAIVLGMPREAGAYATHSEEIRRAWAYDFLGADGQVAPATLDNCVHALAFDLIPGKMRPVVEDQLVGLVRSTGPAGPRPLGNSLLLKTLMRGGHADLAFSLLPLPASATAVGGFLQHYVAGIRMIDAGYRRFQIRPVQARSITGAAGRIDTPFGVLASAWRIAEDGSLRVQVVVPAGTLGTVVLPNGIVHAVSPGPHEFWAASSSTPG